MRIALICTEKLPVPSIRGGAIQILIDGIIPYLKENNEVTVFCVEDEDLPNFEQTEHLRYIRVKRDNYPYEIAIILSKKGSSSEKFDLIHVFNRPKDVLIYKSASPESRFVLSLHNEMFKEGKITYELGSLVIAACDRIITVSEYIKRTILQRFPQATEKTFAFYSGVETNKYHRIYDTSQQNRRMQVRSRYGITEKNKVILFVGRLSKVKGVDILIEAFSLLQETNPETFLLVAGSKWFSDNSIDEYGQKIRDLVQSHNLKNVVFTGFIPPNDIPDIYLAGDIFVCSSQWQEPLARVHYEAMASALPIITTNRGGNGEIFENNKTGIIIDDYYNPNVFCKKIQFLIENPDIAFSLGNNAFEEVSRLYDFKHVYQRIVSYYSHSIYLQKQQADVTIEVEKADEVLKEYPIVYDQIDLKSYKAKKSIFKIHTTQGLLILKKLSVPLHKVKAIVANYKKLINNCKLPKLFTTYKNESFVEKNNSIYLLFEYIEGHKPEYSNDYDLGLLVKALAAFHNSTVDRTENNGIDCFQRNIDYYSKYICRFETLNKYYCNLTECLSEYDLSCKEFIGSAILQCKKAATYLNQLRFYKMELVLCHGDYVAGNTVINANNDLFVFDIDSVDWDFAPRDIRRLCNKIMKESNNGWDLNLLLCIIENYTSIRKLSNFEKNYLLLELWYPHLFYEQEEKYYKNKEISWTSDKYIMRLRKAINAEKSKEQVLIEFEKFLCECQ